MNMMRWMMVFALVTVLGQSRGVAQAAELKIATLDMEKVVKAYPDTRNAEDLLDNLIADLERLQKDSVEKIEKMKKEIDIARRGAQNKALKDEERDVQQKKAEALLEEARKFEREASDSISRQRKNISEQGTSQRKRIVAKIRDLVQEYAVKNGLTLVLDSAGISATGVDTVLFSAPEMDITPDILKIVSEMKPPTSADLAPVDATKEGEDKR